MKEKASQSGSQQLVSGGLWSIGFMVLSGFFWLAWGVQVSRRYGPAGFGLFSMAQSAYNFIWAFVFGGIFEGLIKFGTEHLLEDDSNPAYFFSNYVRYLTGISLVVFVILTAASFLISDNILKILTLSIAFSFLFSGAKDSLASIVGSLKRNRQLSIINSSRAYIVFIVGFIFILFGFPLYTLPTLLLVATIGQLIISLFFCRPYLKDLYISILKIFRIKNKRYFIAEDIKNFKYLIFFGLFISIGKISFNVMKSLDIMVLNLFFDYENVGIYSVADTASSLLFYMTAFSIPIISSISEAWKLKDDELMEEYVKISVKYPLLIGVPLTISIFALAEPLIIGIYGVAFQAAVIPLQILIVGTFLLMFGYTLSAVLVGIGRPKLSGGLMAAAAIQYILSLYVLAPAFGFEGAALALTLTGVTSLFLIPFFIRYYLKINIFSGIHKILVSGAIFAIILFYIPKSNFLTLSLGYIAGLVVFLISLKYTGYIDKEDITLLSSLRSQD
jgi:O-antigen/teichoic acid export membrane protein